VGGLRALPPRSGTECGRLWRCRAGACLRPAHGLHPLRIEGRQSEHPVDIRDAARALSRAFSEQVEELKRFKPNDPDRLVEHEGLVAFFERMASGLAELANALDKAINGATDGKLEPVFLGTAGKIAEQLHLGLMEWLEANRTLCIEVPIRLALFGAGMAFLHSIGADGITAITALTTLVFKRGSAPGKPIPRKKRR